MKRLNVTPVALLITVVCCGLTAGFLTTDADAGFTYRKCGTFEYRGKHLLLTHRFPCAKAERKARYVLRHHRRPPHWRCSLAELPNGFAACHRGKRAWEFVPG